jgi:hypothetical protein
MIVPITMSIPLIMTGPLDGIRKTTASIINQIGVDTQKGLSRKKRTLVTTNLMGKSCPS